MHDRSQSDVWCTKNGGRAAVRPFLVQDRSQGDASCTKNGGGSVAGTGAERSEWGMTAAGLGTDAVAVVGGRVLHDLVDVTSDLAALDGTGTWAVVLPYEGAPTCLRFAASAPVDRMPPGTDPPWTPVPLAAWTTDLDAAAFGAGVEAIRAAIGRGDVYQVNLTRRLTAPLPPGADVLTLGALLSARHPAPYAATVRVPALDLHVASASPELYLSRAGDMVASKPIKGTASEPDGFLAKDRAENVMIVDLVRNDLGRVCEYGTVQVPVLCGVELHPGLAHLVSTVEGRLRPGVGWPELVAATFPPGSITGAPKIAACEHIAALEVTPRGPYTGAIGWVDADRRTGELNVAIRTFWFAEGEAGREVRFGTGGGITWDSSPEGEWAETEVKARRLLAVAAGAGAGAA